MRLLSEQVSNIRLRPSLRVDIGAANEAKTSVGKSGQRGRGDRSGRWQYCVGIVGLSGGEHMPWPMMPAPATMPHKQPVTMI